MRPPGSLRGLKISGDLLSKVVDRSNQRFVSRIELIHTGPQGLVDRAKSRIHAARYVTFRPFHALAEIGRNLIGLLREGTQGLGRLGQFLRKLLPLR